MGTGLCVAEWPLGHEDRSVIQKRQFGRPRPALAFGLAFAVAGAAILVFDDHLQARTPRGWPMWLVAGLMAFCGLWITMLAAQQLLRERRR